MTADVFPVDWAPSNDLIKVLGVGGGGCNAVNYMYKQGVEGCSFIVCNTDMQALRGCDVPEKIQLGHDGLGAGTDPIQGRNAALESQDEIARKVLDTGTQMLFITAGMGGGTGTGAAPVIAKMAKDRGILTVGVVTIPFDNQGNETITRAIDGIHEMEKNVDSLLIIKNQNIITHYGDLLLLGGGGHRTGENSAGGRYALLRKQAREWFPESREAAHWSAQDCMPADGVPYIGRFSAGRPDWYVATGFQKWGMTGSMAAATLLCDLICGKQSPYARVFDPGRFDTKAAAGIAKEGLHAVKGLGRRIFQIPALQAEDLPRGHGGVVKAGAGKLGVCRDDAGGLHAVDIRCPHLGCQLEWNPDEASWDCPCHGSRFDREGRLISGPAQRDLRSGRT